VAWLLLSLVELEGHWLTAMVVVPLSTLKEVELDCSSTSRVPQEGAPLKYW
jgi:hypothetical protein